MVPTMNYLSLDPSIPQRDILLLFQLPCSLVLFSKSLFVHSIKHTSYLQERTPNFGYSNRIETIWVLLSDLIFPERLNSEFFILSCLLLKIARFCCGLCLNTNMVLFLFHAHCHYLFTRLELRNAFISLFLAGFASSLVGLFFLKRSCFHQSMILFILLSNCSGLIIISTCVLCVHEYFSPVAFMYPAGSLVLRIFEALLTLCIHALIGPSYCSHLVSGY